jgi:uncharacterized membrane protein (UPF0127 family)
MRAPHAALATALLAAAGPSHGCRSERPPPPVARVVIDAAGGAAAVRVEVARTPAQREHGLMDRTALAPDAGMIFVFEESVPHAFWMRNTLVALDMIFIGEDGRVAAIVERQPLGLETSDGGVDSRYVLEVNRGWARAHGVKVGDRVRFENVLY